MTTGRTSLVYALDAVPKVCELMHVSKLIPRERQLARLG